MKQTGIVNIRGKEYQTVALRVRNFREQFPSYSLTTEVLHRDEDCVVMKATIRDETDRVIATGHAEEYRKASDINRTSALENAETSAIGRALAALGIGGTEFASADEVTRAVSGDKPPHPKQQYYEALTPERRAKIDALYVEVENLCESASAASAVAHIKEHDLTHEEKVALYWKLSSRARSKIDALEKKAA